MEVFRPAVWPDWFEAERQQRAARPPELAAIESAVEAIRARRAAVELTLDETPSPAARGEGLGRSVPASSRRVLSGAVPPLPLRALSRPSLAILRGRFHPRPAQKQVFGARADGCYEFAADRRAAGDGVSSPWSSTSKASGWSCRPGPRRERRCGGARGGERARTVGVSTRGPSIQLRGSIPLPASTFTATLRSSRAVITVTRSIRLNKIKIDRRLTGLAGPDYDATISFGLPFELLDCPYGKSRLQHPARIHLLFIAPASPVWEPLVEAPRSEEVCSEGNRLVSSSCSCQQ